jgi:hypothetical protein
MKVLYLFLDGTKSPGVINKVKAKISYLNKSGIQTTGLFFNANIKEKRFDEQTQIHYVPARIKPLSKIYFRRGIRNWYLWFHYRSYNKQFYTQLIEEVEKFDFDLVLLRYPLASKGLLKFVRKYSRRIVFEHNSKETVELRLAEKEQQSVKYYIEAEEKYGSRVLSNAAGITAVGNELLNYELSRVEGRNIPGCVIANSYDVNRVKLRQQPEYNGSELRLVFVTGSPSPWVGIDLLLEGLSNYRGAPKVSLKIVGPLSDKLTAMVHNCSAANNIHLTGELNGAELDSCYDEAHLAIGTLAMQRVGLGEHSSLKVLEYAARGIPFIIGYEETNFPPQSEVADCFLNVGYNGKSVDINAMVRFAGVVLNNRDAPTILRNWAVMHFNSEVKMNLLSNFIKSVYAK